MRSQHNSFPGSRKSREVDPVSMRMRRAGESESEECGLRFTPLAGHLIAFDLFESSSCAYTIWLCIQDALSVFASCIRIGLLHELPNGSRPASIALNPRECPVTSQFFAIKSQFEKSVVQASVYVGISGAGLPHTPIPEHDDASAIAAFRKHSLKPGIFPAMIFHLDGPALVSGTIAGPIREHEADEHAVITKSQVVVETRCIMLLHKQWLQLSRQVVRFNFGRAFPAARNIIGRIHGIWMKEIHLDSPACSISACALSSHGSNRSSRRVSARSVEAGKHHTAKTVAAKNGPQNSPQNGY